MHLRHEIARELFFFGDLIGFPFMGFIALQCGQVTFFPINPIGIPGKSSGDMVAHFSLLLHHNGFCQKYLLPISNRVWFRDGFILLE